MLLGTKENFSLILKVDSKYCLSKTSVLLLGVAIDSKLNFNKHAFNITSVAKNKDKSLSRLRYKLDISQKISLYNSYIMSALGYCPVIWMFCGK